LTVGSDCSKIPYMTPATTRLRVGPVVRDDWDSRDMARIAEYENGPNPYRHFLGANHQVAQDLTEAELREVIADCDWQSDPYGPNEGNAAAKAAYRRVLRNAQAALKELT